jgi:hypothetical protein
LAESELSERRNSFVIEKKKEVDIDLSDWDN